MPLSVVKEDETQIVIDGVLESPNSAHRLQFNVYEDKSATLIVANVFGAILYPNELQLIVNAAAAMGVRSEV